MPAASETPTARLKRSFGFNPAESQHHFRVFIPRGNQEITISEHLTWDEKTGSSPATLSPTTDGQIRVILARSKWDAIADIVRTEFNRRLRQQGKPSGIWLTGENWIRLDLGKELVLLAWSIEEAEPSLIQNAVVNWMGLYPEERWWLYTQTAAATGHAIQGRSIGWRKAVRFALTENPTEKTGAPEFFLRAEASEQQSLLEAHADYSFLPSNNIKDHPETNGEG